MRDTLEDSIAARKHLVTGDGALRLFNGFTEGDPRVVIEWYAGTLLIHDYGGAPEVLSRIDLPYRSAVLKVRNGTQEQRNGTLIHGTEKPNRIVENGVAYNIDLTMNRDASFYLDTRGLRQWAYESLKGKRVLNTFAYTGSLGVAAAAGGAQVINTDVNPRFMAFAKVPSIAGDFFSVAARLKGEHRLFDCVFLDPPYVARGVDIQKNMLGLINKVRPLIAHGGALVLVNNAVFFSGADFMRLIGEVCSSGYLSLDKRIDVPFDCVGLRPTWLVDPAPFNHSTKIAILRVTRKDGRT